MRESSKLRTHSSKLDAKLDALAAGWRGLRRSLRQNFTRGFHEGYDDARCGGWTVSLLVCVHLLAAALVIGAAAPGAAKALGTGHRALVPDARCLMPSSSLAPRSVGESAASRRALPAAFSIAESLHHRHGGDGAVDSAAAGPGAPIGGAPGPGHPSDVAGAGESHDTRLRSGPRGRAPRADH